MNNQENPDRFLTLKQASSFLKMSPPTVRKLALDERKITCTLFGKRIKFRLSDLQKFIDENTFHAQSATPE